MADKQFPRDDDFPSWRRLIAATLKEIDQSLSMIEKAPEWVDSKSRSARVSNNFGGFANGLARAAVLRGSAACQPAIAATGPFLPKAIEEIERPLDSRVPSAVDVLAYINTVECCGVKLAREAKEVETGLPPRVAKKARELDESRQRTMAFACLALEKTTLIDKFVISKRPKRVEPGKTFGPNMPALIGYLAVAMEQQAGPEVIEAAWEDFLAEFPMERATETLSWSDLMWCARAVLVHFKKQPLETIADTLHQLVTSKAQAED